MIRTEVVHCADQIHSIMQGGYLLCQRTPTANQRRNPRPERCVQAFNVGGVDHPTALGHQQQRLDLVSRSLCDTSHHSNHPLLGVLLDHLSDGDAIPRSQARASELPRNGFSKDPANCIDVRPTAIHTEQQRTTQRTATHSLHQGSHQMPVTALTDHAAQPQSCLYLNRHRHPYDHALHLDADFIGLDLPPITGVFYQVLVYLLAVLARPTLPTHYRTFVQTKCHDDGLYRTTVSQQGHHHHNQVLGRPQPMENSPSGFSKRLAALVALVPSLLATMDDYVSLTYLSSCGTSQIGAKYGLWVHWLTHLVDLLDQTRLCQWTPFCSSSDPTTV